MLVPMPDSMTNWNSPHPNPLYLSNPPYITLSLGEGEVTKNLGRDKKKKIDDISTKGWDGGEGQHCLIFNKKEKT